MYDCAIPNFALFVLASELMDAGVGVHLVVPSYHIEMASLVLPSGWLEHTVPPPNVSTCIAVAPGANVSFAMSVNETRAAPSLLKAANVDALRSAVFAATAARPARAAVLFIRRHGNREFKPAVLDTMRRLIQPRANLMVYEGNETLADTVRLFSEASVIFGFHGAGAINALFAPAATRRPVT